MCTACMASKHAPQNTGDSLTTGKRRRTRSVTAGAVWGKEYVCSVERGLRQRSQRLGLVMERVGDGGSGRVGLE